MQGRTDPLALEPLSYGDFLAAKRDVSQPLPPVLSNPIKTRLTYSHYDTRLLCFISGVAAFSMVENPTASLS